eukprot:c23000_g2_i3 orf=302-778(+)
MLPEVKAFLGAIICTRASPPPTLLESSLTGFNCCPLNVADEIEAVDAAMDGNPFTHTHTRYTHRQILTCTQSILAGWEASSLYIQQRLLLHVSASHCLGISPSNHNSSFTELIYLHFDFCLRPWHPGFCHLVSLLECHWLVAPSVGFTKVTRFFMALM